ncbi:hypothetical protein [Helicobacter rodentium]|uniref:hypothetical protein n=1 Tax=Helicobacter rodentium TaxID=59617 RepID=UPI002353692A|nr:hypothetical protein [Helicobacter rodentium]
MRECVAFVAIYNRAYSRFYNGIPKAVLYYGLLQLKPCEDAVKSVRYAMLWGLPRIALQFSQGRCLEMQNLDYLRFYECRITPAIIEPNKATI